MPTTQASKPAAAKASGKPNKAANAKAPAKRKAAKAAKDGTPETDASQPAATPDFDKPNPATGKAWTVKEMKAATNAALAKNAEVIQKGGKTKPEPEPAPLPVVMSARSVVDISQEYITRTKDGSMITEIRKGMPAGEWAAVVSELDRTHENVGFMIGDMLVYGTSEYGKQYDLALAATGRNIKTLRNMKSVALNVAREVRKLDTLSFAHHEAVSMLPAAKQSEILEKAEADKLTLKEVRELAKKEKKPKAGKKKPAKPAVKAGATTEQTQPLTEQEEARFAKFNEQVDFVTTFLRGPVFGKLGLVDKREVRKGIKLIAEAYEALVNEIGDK